MIPQSSGAQGDAARSLREDNWENEGGHVAGARTGLASSVPSASGIERLEVQVRVMEITLASDFANGRVGLHHNTYAHRSRVLHQQEAKLNALRANFLAQRQPS